MPTVWRQRRFKFLLGMIEQLPSHSRYAEALAQDDELAEELFDVEQGDGEQQGPPVSSWTPEVALLTLVAERLGIVGQFTAAAARHRYTPPDLPRPTTAQRRVWLRRNLSGHRMRVARMLPPVDDREDRPDAVSG